VLFAVEVDDTGYGMGLSDPVVAAAEQAAEEIVAEIAHL
jgi:hypothetical protein